VIELDHGFDRGAKIRVVGVGGGGGNAVNSMIKRGLHGVEFYAINTDLQALQRNQAPNKIQVGKNLTRGLGAGADPSIGHRAVEEDRDEITRALSGSDMVFITAGMGGGTGTGGAPTVANIAKSLGALVVGIVTRPFNAEGKRRDLQAEAGIEELRKQVDTLIVIPNQKILAVVERSMPLMEAFDIANTVLYNATRGIAEVITVPGLINVDFADVRTVMREMGDAVMGTGVAKGENRSVEAANAAISSPLLDDVSIAGAQGVLVNVTGGPNLSIGEFEEASAIIKEAAGENANIILGTVIDENLSDELWVTVIATGFNKRVAGMSIKVGRTATTVAAAPAGRIPSGPEDLKRFDEPTFLRQGGPQLKGVELSGHRNAGGNGEQRFEHIDKSDPDKPAFLRKIMD
jgi:cell division protein FtsZ